MVKKIIRQGYKQTEIGIIPEDWDAVTLGDVFSISIGGDLDKDLFSQIRDDNHPFPIYSNTVTDQGLYGYSNTYQFEKNSITITGRGVGIGNANARTIPFYAIGRLIVLKPMIEMDCFFVAEYINNKIRIVHETTGVPQLTKPQIAKYLIALPKKPEEQLAIAKILHDVDKLIEKLEEIIKKKENIKQGTMQELLTCKRRLEGYNEKWKPTTLKNCVILITSKSKTSFVVNDGKYLIMDMGSVSTKGKNISQKYTNYEGDFLQYGDLVMPKDDIGGGNIIGKTAFIDENDKYILGDHVYLLRVKNSTVDSKFLFYIINSFKINRELRKKVAGTAQLGINHKSIEEQIIEIPTTIKEQSTIAHILSEMDEEIEELERKRDKYILLKEGMLQKLLTGKIRLK